MSCHVRIKKLSSFRTFYINCCDHCVGYVYCLCYFQAFGKCFNYRGGYAEILVGFVISFGLMIFFFIYFAAKKNTRGPCRQLKMAKVTPVTNGRIPIRYDE